MAKRHPNLKPFPPGHSGNPGGKPKGTKHWVTRLREQALAAYDKAGGVEYLVKQAENHPKAFLDFLAKFLPKNVLLTGDENAPVNIVVQKLYVKPKEKTDG